MRKLHIDGDRVFLRSPTSKDRTEFIRLNRGSRRFHSGLVSPPTTPTQFTDYLERANSDDNVSVLICLTADCSIIGAMTLSQIFRKGFQSAYLGYFIGARYADQGYMTEALNLFLRYTFKELKPHRIEANVQPDNVASIALVKRAGFKLEGYSPRYLKISGRWRDHERWAILAEDWKRQTSKR